MGRHEQLIAYLATLSALVLVALGSLIIAAMFPAVIGKLEVFGFGTITGGLIGVLKIPSQRTVTIDQPESEPVPTREEGVS